MRRIIEQFVGYIRRSVAGRNTRSRATRIDTAGGAFVGGDANIGGGDFVGRDKHEHHYHGPDSANLELVRSPPWKPPSCIAAGYCSVNPARARAPSSTI